jgi:hypothetical protein
MKYCVYDDAGAILRSGTCPDEATALLQGPEGRVLILPDEHTVRDDTHYVDVGVSEVIEMPPRPSFDHQWDQASVSWQLSVASVRAKLKARIEAERDRRIFDNIMLDGSEFDASARSQENLADKLASISSREQLGLSPMDPALCVWRDFQNVIHTFADQPTYRAWLASFAVALADRGTAAYAWSWQKKADLDSVSDDSLSTFDPAN